MNNATAGVKSVIANRPAETATGLTAAVVAVLVATTGLSTPLATALVVVVGALPGLVTAVVSATRSTAAGTLLVGLTPQVKELAESAIADAIAQPATADKPTSLKNIADALASWTAVLSAESGTNAAKKKAADPPAGDPPAH
jgi:hypothetical protein